MQKHIFAVAGGDLRFAFLAASLAEAGYPTYAYGFDPRAELSEKVKELSTLEEFARADAVVLPLPCSSDGRTLRAPYAEGETALADILYAMQPGAVLMGGMLPAALTSLAEELGIETADYIEREELAVKNAVPTAEGAIAIAMNELSATIAGRRVLVTGYGRLGRVLTRMLKAMGAEVTVAARKCSDRAWAEIEGAQAVSIAAMAEAAGRCELVFNTVPAEIFNKRVLRALRRDCLIIDLASKPGGVDITTAKDLGLRTIWALSLPGKAAPETAGEIIKDTILNILCERGGMSDGC